MTMTGIERIGNILQRKPVDRIGLFEHFWSDTQKVWTEQGHIQPGEILAEHFGFDMELCWAFNVVADLDFEPEILEGQAAAEIEIRLSLRIKRITVKEGINDVDLPGGEDGCLYSLSQARRERMPARRAERIS